MTLERIKSLRLSHVMSYVVIIGLFTFIAIRLDLSDKNACERANQNAVKLNTFIDALSDATLKVGAGNSQEILDRVETYQASKATTYKC